MIVLFVAFAVPSFSSAQAPSGDFDGMRHTITIPADPSNATWVPFVAVGGMTNAYGLSLPNTAHNFPTRLVGGYGPPPLPQNGNTGATVRIKIYEWDDVAQSVVGNPVLDDTPPGQSTGSIVYQFNSGKIGTGTLRPGKVCKAYMTVRFAGQVVGPKQYSIAESN
jgi:hypothetical protein